MIFYLRIWTVRHQQAPNWPLGLPTGQWEYRCSCWKEDSWIWLVPLDMLALLYPAHFSGDFSACAMEGKENMQVWVEGLCLPKHVDEKLVALLPGELGSTYFTTNVSRPNLVIELFLKWKMVRSVQPVDQRSGWWYHK